MATSALDLYAQSQGYTKTPTGYRVSPMLEYNTYGMAEQLGIAKTAEGVAQATPIGEDPYSRALQGMMTGGFTPSDPSYDWRFQQGQQALERSQASKGLLGSGNAATELVAYGQGMASTEYQAQFQRLMMGANMATGQYDTAISNLAKMAGVVHGTFQNNQQAQAQSFGQQQMLAQEQGIKSGIEQMMQGGQDPWFAQDQASIAQGAAEAYNW